MHVSRAGVVLPASLTRGQGQQSSDCGPLSGAWVETIEALKWGVLRANQNRGQVGTRILTDSFVPGVSFGRLKCCSIEYYVTYYVCQNRFY